MYVCMDTVVENEGLRESDGWWLQSLSVLNDNGEKWICPCNQWLSLHRSDCQVNLYTCTLPHSTPHSSQLSRVLKAKPHTPKQPDLLEYKLSIATGDARGAGTLANVFITISGSKRTSPKTAILGQFDRASVVMATIETTDVGIIKCLSVDHDNLGFSPDWFLDYITLKYSDNEMYFTCQQWLSRTVGDGAITRTLTPCDTPPKPWVGKSYTVTIVTGNLRGAGTAANVYINLIGSLGESGERRLDNHCDNFARGR